MSAPDCDRACGCRAEVGALEKRLRESHTFAWLVACGVNHHHGCTPGDPCIRCERDRYRVEVERLREQERLAKERAEAVEASYRRMLPVYEAAMKVHARLRGPDSIYILTDLYHACAAAVSSLEDGRDG